MKKVLIYKSESELKPTGGPNGYLYNLRLGLQEIQNRDINIEFLSGNSNSSNVYKLLLKVKKKSPKFISELMSKMGNRRVFNDILTSDGYTDLDLNQYDAIHFHDSFSLYKIRKSLEGYHGKVIVTFHSPKPNYQELLDGVKFKGRKYKKNASKLEQVDLYAFNKANYIFFPCEESEEPYFNQWDKYQSIHDRYKDKIRYIVSGIKKCTFKTTKEEFRNQYNIPQKAFLISYVGRHNEIKGYDNLKIIGQKLLSKYPDIYFICAGAEGPLYGLNHDRWVEVGWTNDPHSIINASDLFILPNKETYFDLVLLEVLSLGKNVLISNTGGNKYFKKYHLNGIMLYKDVEDAIQKVENIMKTNEKIRKQYEEENLKLFEDNFTCKNFAINYIKLLNQLEE